MKKLLLTSIIGSLALGLASASMAATVNFNSGASVYNLGGGTTLTVTAGGGSLYYSSVEDAIGVGTDSGNGGMGYTGSFVTTETLTFTFNKVVNLNWMQFRQWENNVLGFGDKVVMTYSGGTSSGSVTFRDSGLGDGLSVLLDKFLTPGISGTTFKLTPNQAFFSGIQTSVYLHDLDYTVPATVPVPAAAWLMGSGLVGLAGIARRRRS